MKQYMSYLKHVLRDVFTRKLSNQDASQIEQDNLHLAVIFSLPLSIVDRVCSVYFHADFYALPVTC